MVTNRVSAHNVLNGKYWLGIRLGQIYVNFRKKMEDVALSVRETSRTTSTSSNLM